LLAPPPPTKKKRKTGFFSDKPGLKGMKEYLIVGAQNFSTFMIKLLRVDKFGNACCCCCAFY
jgi:hypothetical protein